ncbi:hypothetical protein FXF51_58445 [Nonomuraea sp. PA05]|uniref:hypothetical protein n=1 Tax=Nonomuraea sp. PA05 TaxID=2604466 RepID=UPI0011DA7E5C|nr:hypothetical protein [Nonomuraea sp. PA05]TYB47338.1 hypothetical protein FXF51_58445 [Nonomuraea sp. PA05]
MTPYVPALYALVALTVALAAGYLGRYVIPRPPVGRMVGADIAVMVAALVVMPFAYLHVPVAVVVSIFGLVVLTLAQLTLAPVLGGRWAMITALALCAADVAAYAMGLPLALLVVNDALLILLVVGVVNLWVQAAVTPAQVAALAAALTVYDTLATGMSSLTMDFVERMRELPFAPVLAASYGANPALIGLGDCLMLSIWPLVALRAYGKPAAWTAAGLEAVLLAGSIVLVLVAGRPMPLLTVLGPLIIVQWLYWRRWLARRTPAPARPSVNRALEVADGPAGVWVAVSPGGGVVAEGATPGLARREARLAGAREAPVVWRLQE